MNTEADILQLDVEVCPVSPVCSYLIIRNFSGNLPLIGNHHLQFQDLVRASSLLVHRGLFVSQGNWGEEKRYVRGLFLDDWDTQREPQTCHNFTISFVTALFQLPVQFGKMLWWSSFRNIKAVVFPLQSVDVDWPPRKDEIDDQLKDSS